jgi:hypothetical protein
MNLGKQVKVGNLNSVSTTVVNIAPMTSADLDEVCALLRACFNWLADREGFTPAERAFLTGERSSVETVLEESKRRLQDLIAAQSSCEYFERCSVAKSFSWSFIE